MEPKIDLKILAAGKSTQDISQKKGKLFEKLIRIVLKSKGITISNLLNVNYAGMEIDLEGKLIIGDIPIYIECKYYSKNIESPKLQSFFGKYMAKWLENEKSIGIFMGIPGINSHARGYYNQYIKNKKPRINCELYEKKEIIDFLLSDNSLINKNIISRIHIENEGNGLLGDCELIYTEKGFFWIQFITPKGKFIASSYVLYRIDGNIIQSKTDIHYITNLYPKLKASDMIYSDNQKIKKRVDYSRVDQIAEVQGGSSPFEYQFPAPPKYFIGRNNPIEDIKKYIASVIQKKTSSRGLLFKANSGHGKSSLVLKTINELEKEGHIAIAIDSRSATTQHFILKTFEYIIQNNVEFKRFFDKKERPDNLSGINGLFIILSQLAKKLEEKEKILLIFFDQFENLFHFPKILETIRNFFLKVCDLRSNIVIGFSWKLDQIGSLSEFPYKLRDDISNLCKPIKLSIFSENEKNEVIDKLGENLDTKIRDDLRFLISDYSQGFPWLLIKLCAHVKFKRESGIRQIDLFTRGLNVRELFEQDLHNLSSQEEELLKRISKLVPVSISELSEIISPEQIESFVNQRLIVKIGYKYDLYWDIFRDYLNSGNVPIEEYYLLRMSVNRVFHAIHDLNNQNKEITIIEFKNLQKISDKSFMNLASILKLLDLAEIDNEYIKSKFEVGLDEDQLLGTFQSHIKDKLMKNKIVQNILERLNFEEKLEMNEIEEIIKQTTPYINAKGKTWRGYATNFASWIDIANLGILNERNWILLKKKK